MSAASTVHEPSAVHVAIVEDDPGFLDALRDAIQKATGMRVTDTATTRVEGLALLNGPPADVLLVDLGLPDGSGIDVIDAAARRWRSCNIMVSTNFGDEAHVMRSIEAGAVGYLLKDSSPARIAEEIGSLARGGSPISPIIARQILARLAAGDARSEPPGGHLAGRPSVLSAREITLLDLVTNGFATQEIAQRLQLSQLTVRALVRRIYGEFRAALVVGEDLAAGRQDRFTG